MGVDLKKLSHLILFVGLLPTVSLWLAGFDKYIPNLPWWIDKPTPLVIYGLLFILFDIYLWKINIFRFFGVVTVPNLEGRWEGKHVSSHKENGLNTEVPGALEIDQTFSKISFRAYFPESKSKKVIASFGNEGDNQYLYYTYDSEIAVKSKEKMKNHLGTAKVEYVESGKSKKLKGTYFNSAGNTGDMEYLFSSKQLKHDL
ncbi:MAG TPA: hypothetical protein VLF93_03220 [Candidatus Saccharimonadales bacterium]|nr:hypothetical protein [Candidatus Saccharimonadales bacterium]